MSRKVQHDDIDKGGDKSLVDGGRSADVLENVFVDKKPVEC